MARTLPQDVRLLGDTLGEILQAHAGEALLAREEEMRLSAKAAREAEDDAAREAPRARLAEIADGLDAETAYDVVRAFTAYFRLVNLAEDVERTRIIRRREREGQGAVSESLGAALSELKDRGATREEVLAALADLHVRFVFTSHPTEARRRTTERLLSGIRGGLKDLERRSLTPEEEAAVLRGLRAGAEALWEHADLRDSPPAVLDEVKAGLWYLRHVLLDVLPWVQRRLAASFAEAFGPVDPLELPVPLSFGSWMGSDRDGNPHVTDAVTERTMEFHRHIVLERYLADLARLGDALAATEARLASSPALDEALARAEAAVPEVADRARRQSAHEPLRRLLTFMRARLERSLRFAAGGYADPDAFLEDLAVVREVLAASGARALPDDALLDLVLRVRAFGFVLAPLDVREDARVHREVVAELLGEPAYPSWDDATRREALARLRLPARGTPLTPQARRLLDLFATIGRIQTRFGEAALGTYAISMAEHPADVLEVLALAELHRLDRSLDVVPLLETREGLGRAGAFLRSLYADPRYAAHLADRDGRQELLVGYSDSMKQAGILTSRVEVLEAQLAACEASAEAGIVLRVFHGRGGSVSRGGGPTHRAIRALPRAAFSGDVKITEQGETRAFHFGDPDLAVRYLERTLGAALVVRWEGRTGAVPPHDPGLKTLRRLAEAAFEAYRGLVEEPGFMAYFTQATPFDAIAALNIASRPSKRGRAEGLSDLRAIPWVFSWSQSRHLVTGWYGVGAALEAVGSEPGGRERLRRLVEESPFFRDLLDNVQMSLAKADLGIASRYAELCEDEAVRRRIFGAIEAEHRRAVAGILELTGQQTLLENDPVLLRSLRLRNPYVDPLSYLQVQALRRLRAGDEAWRAVARSAVNGIAAGLRNTG